jgi:restriction system protein
MRRRSRGSADDFLGLVALLPWWAGIALAVASYLLLHRLSVAPAGPMQSGQMGAFVQQSMVAAFANIAQFLVPLLCLGGAAMSFLKRRKRKALLETVTRSDAAVALAGMSWREFELLVGEAFRLQGYAVTEQGGSGPDGGVDLVLRKGTERFVVQCKQWKAFKVSVSVVRDLFGVMAARGAAGGFVVTCGTFTADAKAFAEGRNVELIDGPALLGLIRRAKASLSSAGAAAAATMPATATATATPPRGSEHEVPGCPLCRAPMNRRTARKGANAGAQFWGCSRFPACRGTR